MSYQKLQEQGKCIYHIIESFLQLSAKIYSQTRSYLTYYNSTLLCLPCLKHMGPYILMRDGDTNNRSP